MIKFEKFIQKKYEYSDEWKKVCMIANQLISHLNEPIILEKINQANQPNISSSKVQSVFLVKAQELGFKDESLGLFKNYENKRIRPDYFLQLEKTGILMEVERGKTNHNNMDFLDFWKCHICLHAHYLFLCVPQELKQNAEKDKLSKPFQTTVSHMSAFFQPINYTNVRGLFVIGY